MFNEEKLEVNENIDPQDKGLLNAIMHYYNSQFYTHTLTSSLGGFQVFEDVIDAEEIVSAPRANKFIEILANRLGAGDPVVITVGGVHSINAIDLAQDNADSNLYHIGVYDNNHPGEKYYIDLKCTKLSCKGIKKEYLKDFDRLKDEFHIIMSTSLDETLKYID